MQCRIFYHSVSNFSEISLGPDDVSSVSTMMAENAKDILEIEQRLAAARRSEPRPPPSLLMSGLLDSIARSIDEFRSTTPEPEEPDVLEDEGDDEDEEDNEQPRQAPKPSAPALKKTLVEDDEHYDTSSGLWRMLSAYDNLVLSQPGQSYREEKHWLDTDPVPWSIMEESRNKCLEWLEKHHEQIGI